MKRSYLVESVFKSMKRDEQLALIETNECRNKFYNTTKQPIQCPSTLTAIKDSELRDTIRGILSTLVEMGTGWSTISVSRMVITSVQPLMVELDMFVKFVWKREHPDGKGKTTDEYEVQTKRPTKFSTVVNNLVKEKQKFFESLATDKHAFRFSDNEQRVQQVLEQKIDDLTKTANSRVKDLVNRISASSKKIWIYFTTFEIYKHYLELSNTQYISSCMSKEPSYYGNKYNGEYRHPLQGYEYSPDFRLALFSTYSPDEIRNADEYPFIARSMIFPIPIVSNEPLAFSRVYGNEIAQRVFRKMALQIEKPEGYIVYGVMCNDYKKGLEHDRISEWIADRYEATDEENSLIKGHMIAPFIDTWNNCLHIVGDGKPFIREDGIEVVELRTGCYGYTQEEEDVDEYLIDSEKRNSIYYGSGIVEWHVGERDYTWECYWDGEEWVVGDYDI